MYNLEEIKENLDDDDIVIVKYVYGREYSRRTEKCYVHQLDDCLDRLENDDNVRFIEAIRA